MDRAKGVPSGTPFLFVMWGQSQLFGRFVVVLIAFLVVMWVTERNIGLRAGIRFGKTGGPGGKRCAE